ncbi:mitochondrial import inner membrane translocase subunit Tim23B isoform X2 [Pan paniscus]|uniref:mitochondrial import inner membrane translocase subunit Tim23B isoform X2 n=1 Tax=Pan paniscus TaxID=9597 RepID=UPI0024365705|nr:mitochondrial import inner membrane translocase subunit Tim23B isoform X2 [Pan paniscus]
MLEAAAGTTRFAAIPWKEAGEAATKPQGYWPVFSEPAEQVTRTRIWLASRDTDEFILPIGANKTWGRFELAFFTIGGCCMTGAAFGAMNGLRLGLKETQNMASSKPGNVQILNMVTRQGALWANTLGSLALLYSAFGVIVEKTRGAEDDLNTVAAGTMTGMLYKCTVSEMALDSPFCVLLSGS